MASDTENPVVRERPGCVLGIALGLLVLGSIVAWIWLPKGKPRDGAKLYESWFGATAMPAEFSISASRQLAGGEEVLQLAHTTAAPERALVPAAPKSQTPTKPVDWGHLELGAGEQLPRSMTLVHYPKERAQSNVNRLFSDQLQVGKLEEIGRLGGRMVLEFGTIPWGEQFTPYVVEREFETGGTFRDVARVNLSKAGDALILHAAWARSEPFSKARLQSLLETLRRP